MAALDSARPPLRRLILAVLAAAARPLVADASRIKGDAEILLIRPDHLGDLLFTTPALRLLRAQMPRARISYLVGPWGSPVASRNAYVDQVIYCDFPWFAGQPAAGPWHPYLLLLRQALWLRRRRIGAAINLRFDFWWGAALAYLAGIPYRLGYGTGDCLPFLSASLPYKTGRHEVLQNFGLVEHFVRSASPSVSSEFESIAGELEYPLAPKERAFAEAYLASRGIGRDTPLVVIHSGTRGLVKRWPEDRFARVADVLARQLHARVLLTGTAGEREMASRIAGHCESSLVIASGDTTLGQLGAFFERAAIVLGVDSGPLHLAVALGRPTVHLFGPSDPIAFGPYGDHLRHAVVRSDYPCAPCGKLDWPRHQLPLHDCMSAITVEQVLRAAERVLEAVCPELP